MRIFGEREQYTLLGEPGDTYPRERPRIKINNEGANIIWAAYYKLWGNCQTMDKREDRGGIAYVSELDYMKNEGALDKDFDYKNYLI